MRGSGRARSGDPSTPVGSSGSRGAGRGDPGGVGDPASTAAPDPCGCASRQDTRIVRARWDRAILTHRDRMTRPGSGSILRKCAALASAVAAPRLATDALSVVLPVAARAGVRPLGRHQCPAWQRRPRSSKCIALLLSLHRATARPSRYLAVTHERRRFQFVPRNKSVRVGRSSSPRDPARAHSPSSSPS